MRWSILAVALVAVGCTSGQKDKDATTDEDKTDGTEGTVFVDTGDTGPGVKADWFSVSAIFASDGTSALSFMSTSQGQAVEVFPTVVVSFATDTGDKTAPLGRTCSVTITAKENQNAATWTADADPVPWFGFNVPPGKNEAELIVDGSDCEGKWNKDLWGVPGELVEGRGFGATLAPLTADVSAQFDAFTDPTQKAYYQTNAIGAGWQLGTLAPLTSQYKGGVINGGFTFGAELDKDRKPVPDPANPDNFKLIPAADLYKEEQLASALYVTNSLIWVQTTLFTLADSPSAQDVETRPMAPDENPALEMLLSGRLGVPVTKLPAPTTAAPVGATPVP